MRSSCLLPLYVQFLFWPCWWIVERWLTFHGPIGMGFVRAMLSDFSMLIHLCIRHNMHMVKDSHTQALKPNPRMHFYSAFKNTNYHDKNASTKLLQKIKTINIRWLKQVLKQNKPHFIMHIYIICYYYQVSIQKHAVWILQKQNWATVHEEWELCVWWGGEGGGVKEPSGVLLARLRPQTFSCVSKMLNGKCQQWLKTTEVEGLPDLPKNSCVHSGGSTQRSLDPRCMGLFIHGLVEWRSAPQARQESAHCDWPHCSRLSHGL